MEFIGMLLAKALVAFIVGCVYIGSALGWLLMLFVCWSIVKDALYEWRYRSRWEAAGSMAGALFLLLFLMLIPWSLWITPDWWR